MIAVPKAVRAQKKKNSCLFPKPPGANVKRPKSINHESCRSATVLSDQLPLYHGHLVTLTSGVLVPCVPGPRVSEHAGGGGLYSVKERCDVTALRNTLIVKLGYVRFGDLGGV